MIEVQRVKLNFHETETCGPIQSSDSERTGHNVVGNDRKGEGLRAFLWRKFVEAFKQGYEEADARRRARIKKPENNA